MVTRAIAEFWGKVSKYKRGGQIVRLEIGYVVQLHEDGPWYAGCLGERVGGAHTSKEAAMRHVSEWLHDNVGKIDWRKMS